VEKQIICPWIVISNARVDKSLADDLIKERGIVSSRVALLLRSAEIKPLFYRFVSKTQQGKCE
jgi:hypothetical protein